MFISPGWDVAAGGGHVVYRRTTPRSSGSIATLQTVYAMADGGDAAQIAPFLAAHALVHLRPFPVSKRAAITATYPSRAVLVACVDSPGTSGDPCFAPYSPGAASFAAGSSDGQSFVAATVDASYSRTKTRSDSLVRYTLGSANNKPIAVAYGPWSTSSSGSQLTAVGGPGDRGDRRGLSH